MKVKIGVFDSGKGGLSTLNTLKMMVPDAEYCYIADTEHHPYGEKTTEELLEITAGVCQKLVDAEAKIIVIACNTATTQCIGALRERFPEMSFVGTEPAVKPACEMGGENILVLATPGTAKSQQLKKLIRENAGPKQKVVVQPCAGLAEAVESDDTEKLQVLLDEIYAQVGGDKYDAIVLGCTHYVLIAEKIQRKFPHAKLFDGNAGVASVVRQYLTLSSPCSRA